MFCGRDTQRCATAHGTVSSDTTLRIRSRIVRSNALIEITPLRAQVVLERDVDAGRELGMQARVAGAVGARRDVRTRAPGYSVDSVGTAIRFCSVGVR